MNEYGHFGAAIERGEIESIGEDGYRVRSFTRYGILTKSIPSLGNSAYSVGDHVYYFLFPDGSGMILAGF